MIKDNGDGTLTVSAPCDFDIHQPASPERSEQMMKDFARWRDERGLCPNTATSEHKWLERIGKNKDKPEQCICCNRLKVDIERQKP